MRELTLSLFSPKDEVFLDCFLEGAQQVAHETAEPCREVAGSRSRDRAFIMVRTDACQVEGSWESQPYFIAKTGFCNSDSS